MTTEYSVRTGANFPALPPHVVREFRNEVQPNGLCSGGMRDVAWFWEENEATAYQKWRQEGHEQYLKERKDLDESKL